MSSNADLLDIPLNARNTKAGDPSCKTCGGVGSYRVKQDEGYKGPPVSKLCACAAKLAVIQNLDRGFTGLSKAPKILSSPMLRHADRNLWVTAGPEWFKAHLRHVAIRRGADWSFYVATDAELMQAWLATASMTHQEISDSDVVELNSRRSLMFRTLTDLAVPPRLLVIRLGVKTARNVAMPEVLLESVRMRSHEGMPTWIWDQIDKPLTEGHLCWSPEVADEFDDWERCCGAQDVFDEPKVRTTTPQNLSTRNLIFAERAPDRTVSPTTGSDLLDSLGDKRKKKRSNTNGRGPR